MQAGALCQAFAIPLSAQAPAPSVHAHPCCALDRACHLEYFHDHARIEHMFFEEALTPTHGELRPDLSRPWTWLGVQTRRCGTVPNVHRLRLNAGNRIDLHPEKPERERRTLMTGITSTLQQLEPMGRVARQGNEGLLTAVSHEAAEQLAAELQGAFAVKSASMPEAAPCTLPMAPITGRFRSASSFRKISRM